MKHEFGHYFFGGGHPTHGKNTCGNSDPYGFWGILSANPHYTVTAVDRERLQWINFNEIGLGRTYANIGDFLTQPGEAYRLIIPGTNEAFILENHQQLLPGAASVWDDPNHLFPGKGLFIYHVDNIDLLLPHYDILSAEGDFTWSNPSWYHYVWSDYDSIPVFKQVQANRNGLDGRDWIPHTKPFIRNGCFRIYGLEINGQGVFHERLWGDEKDAFKMGYNQVVSPYSNPQMKTENGLPTNTAIEITGKSIGINGEDIYNVTFFNGGTNGDPLDASPSKPQGLSISLYTDQLGYKHPLLNWLVMLETDVTNGGYIDVWRRRKQNGTWSSWAILEPNLAGSSTQFIDMSIGTAGSGNDSADYKILARDATGLSSVFSAPARINVNPAQWKQGSRHDLPTKFDLAQNYPNPFNPSTQINFGLPENVNVSLVVYDVLGRKVAELANGYREAGYHSTTWDASDVASGVYFARFTAVGGSGDVKYSKINKLLLMK